MASHNSYPGYVKLPGKQLYHDTIRLDFNARIESDSVQTKLRGFSLRMFTLPEPKDFGKQTQPEISVTLTAEQWLDLIDEMRRVLDQSDDIRKSLEDMDQAP